MWCVETQGGTSTPETWALDQQYLNCKMHRLKTDERASFSPSFPPSLHSSSFSSTTTTTSISLSPPRHSQVEVKYWPKLFASGSEPERLMNEVLISKPEVAARFLAVVQGYSSTLQTLGLGEKCLSVCVAQRRYQLCEQLSNFLTRAHEALEHEQAQAEQSAWLYTDTAPPPPCPVSRILSDHLVGLLDASHLRFLGDMLTAFGEKALLQLLEDRKGRIAAERRKTTSTAAKTTPIELATAMRAVHAQYAIPLPLFNDADPTAGDEAGSWFAAGRGTHRTLASVASFLFQAKRPLLYMACSAVLLNRDMLVEGLRVWPHLSPILKAALDSFDGVPGYRTLDRVLMQGSGGVPDHTMNAGQSSGITANQAARLPVGSSAPMPKMGAAASQGATSAPWQSKTPGSTRPSQATTPRTPRDLKDAPTPLSAQMPSGLASMLTSAR